METFLKQVAHDLYGKLGLTKPEESDDVLQPAVTPDAFPGLNTELNREEDDKDEVDDLLDDELEEWQPVMQPFYDDLAKAASECHTFEEFKARMTDLEKKFELKEEIVEKIALAMFKARALGADSVMKQED